MNAVVLLYHILSCRRTCCSLGRLPLPGIGVYCMSKHAATALANVLRFELKQWGITVHDIQPGFFRQVVCLLLLNYWYFCDIGLVHKLSFTQSLNCHALRLEIYMFLPTITELQGNLIKKMQRTGKSCGVFRLDPKIFIWPLIKTRPTKAEY
jgi:hypothetical protein